MDDKDIITSVLRIFRAEPVRTEPITSMAALEAWLAEVLEELASTDFQAFLNLLYRIDVSESKVTELTDQSNRPYLGIARLIIERQRQKQEWKEKLSRDNPFREGSGEERWD